MDKNKRRRRSRRSKPEIEFHILAILFALLLLIPLVFWWFGNQNVKNSVPEYATGYVVEISDSAVTADADSTMDGQ